jgi:hypothetical protein
MYSMHSMYCMYCIHCMYSKYSMHCMYSIYNRTFAVHVHYSFLGSRICDFAAAYRACLF